MSRLAFIIALLFAAPWEEAESVEVRNLGPMNLRPLICQDITRSSLIERVCYDEANRHMVVRHRAVYDQYCELPKDVADAFLNAPSMGRYFNANIAGAGRPGQYDCGTRTVS
jgi:hypothetical protein